MVFVDCVHSDTVPGTVQLNFAAKELYMFNYLFIMTNSLYRDLRIIPFVIVVVPNTLKNRQSFIGSVESIGFSESELLHEKFMRKSSPSYSVETYAN